MNGGITTRLRHRLYRIHLYLESNLYFLLIAIHIWLNHTSRKVLTLAQHLQNHQLHEAIESLKAKEEL